MAKKAFYRTYRPQTFSDVYGQSHVKKTLENAISSGTFSHAYLFSGPRGIGKTTFARLISKSINCEKRKENSPEPCNQCAACAEINEGGATDVLEMDAASHRGIDEIRSLREKVRVSPLRLKYKVFIIDEVHMLTKEAFDALLKTLEEPHAHSVFILATTEFEKIPKTIMSRCQSFSLHKIPFDELSAYLQKIAKSEKIKLGSEVIDYITFLSGGYARDAVSLLNQIATLEKPTLGSVKELLGVPASEYVTLVIESAQKNDMATILDVIQKVISKGYDINQFADLLLSRLRFMLLLKYQESDSVSYYGVLDESEYKTLKNLSASFDETHATKLMEAITKYQQLFVDSPHPELFLEMAFLSTADKKSLNDQQSKLIHSSKTEDSPEKKGVEKKPQKPEKEKERAENEKKEKKPKEKGPVVEKNPAQKSTVKKTVSASFKEVEKKWPKVLTIIQKENYSLAGLLKSSCLFDLKGDTLIIVLDFDFHFDRIDDPKNKRVIQAALESEFNEPILVQPVLLSHLSDEEQKKIANQKKVAQTKKKKVVEETYNSAVEVFGSEPDLTVGTG
ncbi:DNA polymerase III subunit gamma/tau [Patescibacteria group bacterium]|nr:DNA polymerase III subunit gamma/tau [Patescibacteria group bacterium]